MAFRNEVLGLVAERIADLASLIDAVAFHKLDRQLAAALSGHGPQLTVTRGREQIQIANRPALRRLAATLAA